MDKYGQAHGGCIVGLYLMQCWHEYWDRLENKKITRDQQSTCAPLVGVWLGDGKVDSEPKL